MMRTAGFLRLFLPQLPGEQGVQTHGGTHANGDHQKLDGIYKRGGGQGLHAIMDKIRKIKGIDTVKRNQD